MTPRALAPTGAGRAVLEGLVTLMHASGATGIGTFLLVGSDTALVRNTYTAASPARAPAASREEGMWL